MKGMSGPGIQKWVSFLYQRNFSRHLMHTVVAYFVLKYIFRVQRIVSVNQTLQIRAANLGTMCKNNKDFAASFTASKASHDLSKIQFF